MRLSAHETLGGCESDPESGVLWGHEGHGGAFAYVWEGDHGEDPLVFTGTTNNDECPYDDFVCEAITIHLEESELDDEDDDDEEEEDSDDEESLDDEESSDDEEDDEDSEDEYSSDEDEDEDDDD